MNYPTKIDFDFIFILNPTNTDRVKNIVSFCNSLDFSLSKIYILGDEVKLQKEFMSKFLPYFRNVKSFDEFIEQYGDLFYLYGNIYLVINNIYDFRKIDKYRSKIKYVEVLTSIYGLYSNHIESTEFLKYIGFKEIFQHHENLYQLRSVWKCQN